MVELCSKRNARNQGSKWAILIPVKGAQPGATGHDRKGFTMSVMSDIDASTREAIEDSTQKFENPVTDYNGDVVEESECTWVECEEEWVQSADLVDYMNDHYLAHCNYCGEIFDTTSADAVVVFHHGIARHFCDEACANRCGYHQCADCGEWDCSGNMYETHDGDMVCESCMESNYFRCDNCEDLFPADELRYSEIEDCYYCADCYAECKSAIHKYGYKPCTIFHGDEAADNQPFLGIEIEIDGGDDASKTSRALQAIDPGEQMFYLKHDGSLDYGIEIVTHPHTLKAFYKFPWEQIVKIALDAGFRSNDTDTCGIHVHIDRAYFGPPGEKRDIGIYQLMRLIDRFRIPLQALARRRDADYAKWTPIYIDDVTKAEPLKAYEAQEYQMRHYDRYHMINLENYNTVELRFFKGSLNLTTIRATLALVTSLAVMAATSSETTIETLTWDDFSQDLAMCDDDYARYSRRIFRRFFDNVETDAE